MKKISQCAAVICLLSSSLAFAISGSHPGDAYQYQLAKLKNVTNRTELVSTVNEAESLGVVIVFNPKIEIDRNSPLAFKRKSFVMAADKDTQIALCKLLNIGKPSFADTISKAESQPGEFAVKSTSDSEFEIIPTKTRPNTNKSSFGQGWLDQVAQSSAMVLQRLVCVQ